MKKKIFIVAVLLLLFGSCNEVFAKEIDMKSEVDSPMVFLMDGKGQEEQLEVLRGIVPKSALHIIEEINVIYIDSEQNVNPDEICHALQMKGLDSPLNYGAVAGIQMDAHLLSELDDDELEKLHIGDINRNTINEDLLYNHYSWNFDMITNSGESLNFSTGNGVKIALLDSGVDTEHPRLKNSLALSEAKSFVPDDESINDITGHGTMVAGVIARIAPDAELIPYKVINETGNALWTVEAIITAANDKVDVINMSLGTYKTISDSNEYLTYQLFERAVAYAAENNCYMVSSIGNENLDLDVQSNNFIEYLPSCFDDVIAVSGITKNKNLASYSNYGKSVNYCAPGGDIVVKDGYVDLEEWIYTIFPKNIDNGLSSIDVPQGYMFTYGTSLAAPHVTASLSSILGRDNEVKYEKEELLQLLNNGAENIGGIDGMKYYGNGLINLCNSFKSIIEE